VTRFGGDGGDLDLLVLGDINPDLVLADSELEVAFGQAERVVDEAALTVGGSGAIMACAAARLGLRTAIAGVVGEDLFGRFMLDALAERGVLTDGVVIDGSARTGLTVVLVRPGDRAILTFPGAIEAMRADLVPVELLARARHVHVASYYLQTGLIPGLPALLDRVRAQGSTTSIDPNWDPAEVWDAGLRRLLAAVDLFLPNATEACRIADVADPRRAAERLCGAGPIVAVKLGSDGAVAARDGDGLVCAAAPAGIDPLDAVGAGDAFDAGVLAGLLAGEPLDQALALGCACGTLSTRAAGGTGAQPTLAEARAARARL